MNPRLLNKKALCKYLSVSPPTIEKWMRDERIPKPLKDTHRWDRLLVDEYINRASGLKPHEPIDVENITPYERRRMRKDANKNQRRS